MIRSVGFTLVELMVVVVIIAVLAAIGYPAYQNQMEEGRLSEGRAALSEVASQLERCYSRYGAYDDDSCETMDESETGIYDIDIEADANSFTATAERDEFSSSNQCGDLTITQTGRKGVSSGASWDVDRCW